MVSTTRKRKLQQRRKYLQRRVGRHYIPRGLRIKRHIFKQTYYPSATSLITDGVNCKYQSTNGDLLGPDTSASGDGFFSLMFILADCPQSSTFKALFDAYMIKNVKVKFVPLVNMVNQSSTTPGSSTAVTQFLETVIDYDDNSLLTAESQALEYETFRQTAGYRQQWRSITPCVSQAVYKASGTTIGYSQRRKQWIDAAYDDVEHFGIKGVVPTTSTVGANMQMRWRVFVTATYVFKQVR